MKFPRMKAAATAVVVAALALTGCSAGGAGGSSGGSSTLTLGSLLEPGALDPGQAQEGNQIVFYQAAYDSLIRRLPNGDLAPMLATDWSYSDDALALTLNLRNDVTFSDGAKLDAAAVKANMEHFKNGSGSQAHTLGDVASVEVVDDDTVTVHLAQPDPALLVSLSNAAGLMGSPAALGTDGIKTNPVGSGPYTLNVSKSTSGSEWVFDKRAGYWDPSLQKYDRIVIKYLADASARMNALLSGQIDAVRIDAAQRDRVSQGGLTIERDSNDWVGFILYDRAGQKVPALGDVRVRQAINMAIDREALLKQFGQGEGELTNQVFGPRSTGFQQTLDGTYEYNPEKARQLIQEAGYGSGIEIPYGTSALGDPAMTAVLVEQLAAIGITLKLTEVPAAEGLTSILEGRFGMGFMALFQPSSWTTISQAIAPDATFNPFHTSSPELQALIEQVRRGDDAAAQAVNTYVVENAWFAPWYRATTLFAHKPSVTVELQAEQAVPSIYNYAPAK